MAEVIIQANIKDGDTISVGLKKDKSMLTFKVQKQKKPNQKAIEK